MWKLLWGEERKAGDVNALRVVRVRTLRVLLLFLLCCLMLRLFLRCIPPLCRRLQVVCGSLFRL